MHSVQFFRVRLEVDRVGGKFVIFSSEACFLYTALTDA